MCLSLLCVNNGPGNVKQKHMRLVHVQTISIVVLADRPFCTKRFFELSMRTMMLRVLLVVFQTLGSFRPFKEHISWAGDLLSGCSLIKELKKRKKNWECDLTMESVRCQNQQFSWIFIKRTYPLFSRPVSSE